MDGPAVPALFENLKRRRVSKRAFREAYVEHFAFIWRSLVRLGVPADEAEDAVQEVFVVAFRRWTEFEQRSSLPTWLFGIARRVASHDRRSRERRTRRTEAFGASVADACDGEAQAEARHARTQLHTFLDALEPAKREVFVLADLEGFTGREVASALGIKPNTAWSRLKAARAEFARQFGGNVRKRPKVIVDLSTPPPEARGRVWAVLVPQLGLAGKAAGAGASGVSALKAWTVAFNFKIFGATVGVGLGTVAAVHAATEPPAVAAAPAPARSTANKASHANAPAKKKRARRIKTAAQGGQPPPLPPAPVVAEPTPPVPIQRPAGMKARLPPQPAPPKLDPLAPDLTGIGKDDLGVMQRARKALRARKPRNALLLVEEHARRFPNSRLSTLRKITRIESLCAAGKKPQGLGEAAALLKKAGGNKRLKRRVQKACGLRVKTTPKPPAPSKVAMIPG